MIQLTLALDRLLETVADVSKDLGDEGARAVQNTGLVLTIRSHHHRIAESVTLPTKRVSAGAS